MVHIQVKNRNKQSSMKIKSPWPTDGLTNYIAGWKQTLEPDSNAIFSAKYSIHQ